MLIVAINKIVKTTLNDLLLNMKNCSSFMQIVLVILFGDDKYTNFF